MSRLDSFIARMQAQRDCLNFLKPKIDALPGPDPRSRPGQRPHLRSSARSLSRPRHLCLRAQGGGPSRLHPAGRPAVSGRGAGSLAKAAQKLGATAALIHTDLGTGDHAANMAMGQWLGPALDALAGPGGYVLANQPLDVARWRRQPDPPGVPKDRYFLYRVG